MKKLIILFIIILFSPQSQAQNWTVPVDVSHMGGINREPSFCIDNNAHIHCVWEHYYNTQFSVVCYSKSIDNGYSWSIAENVSQNDEKRNSNINIVCDSENNLFITYDHDSNNSGGSQIHYQKYNGIFWSEAINIAETMPGSWDNKLIVDNNDRVYCFWFRLDNNGSIFYRYLENEEWSDIIIPYNDNELNGLESCVVDSENNLHCIGPHWFSGQGNTDSKPTYFSYNYDNNVWSDFEEFGETYSWRGMDIDMDENEKPHLVWQEYIYQSNGSILSGTFYNFQDENDLWAPSIYLGEGYSNQRIIIDNHNQTNVFHLESIEEVSLLIQYYKYNTNWVSYILPIENVGDFEVEKCDNQICIVLEDWTISNTNTCEVKFTKTDLIDYTKTEEQNNDFYISPNPTKQNLNINFHLEKMERVTIHIYNLHGELIRTLLNESKPSGNHQLFWNTKDEYGREVKSGLYLIRLQTDHHIQTQRVEYMR